jgi:hypothetical protein
MTLRSMPGWIVDDATSVREEVARYTGMSRAELWHLTEACAKDAMWAARASGMFERVLAHRDPLPESSVAALVRLRSRR